MAAERHYFTSKPLLYSLQWCWVKCWASRAGNTHRKHIDVLYRGFKSQGLLNVNRNIKVMFYWSGHFKWIQRSRENKLSREVKEEVKEWRGQKKKENLKKKLGMKLKWRGERWKKGGWLCRENGRKQKEQYGGMGERQMKRKKKVYFS